MVAGGAVGVAAEEVSLEFQLHLADLRVQSLFSLLELVPQGSDLGLGPHDFSGVLAEHCQDGAGSGDAMELRGLLAPWRVDVCCLALQLVLLLLVLLLVLLDLSGDSGHEDSGS